MSGELYIIACAVSGCFLFALGGTEIPLFGKGFKWLRREVLPLIWGILAFMAGIELWRCLVFAVCQDGVFRLPYGDRTPTWLKLVVFLTYPLPSLLFGLTIWQAYVGAICFLMFVLSNWKPTEKIFSWVISCLIMGFLLGIMVGQILSNTLR